MSAHKNLYIIILSFIMVGNNLYGQELKDLMNDSVIEYIDTIPSLELIAEFKDGQMYLRWAPDHALTWYESTPFGYKIERFEIDDETLLPILTSRDTALVKAWPKEKFEAFASDAETYKYELTMAECMYGDVTQVQKGKGFALQNSEIENKYGFGLFAADMSFNAAVAGGLGYIDKTNVVAGKTYFYRVKTMLPDTLVEPGYITVQAKEELLPQPYLSSCIEGEGKVTLQWNRDNHEPYYSGYFIEKSLDNVTFKKLQEVPFVGGVSKEFPSHVFSYTDFVSNYQPHYYRIVGVSPFSIHSKPSASIKLIGRDRTPCPEPQNIKIVTEELTKSVTIEWDPVLCSDLKGYQIMKGTEPEGEFTKLGAFINKSSMTKFKETLTSTRGKNYYKIVSIDSAGNQGFTLPRLAAFRDTFPPAIPTGLKGKVDIDGVVTITWNKNKEEDLRGYHIYRANAEYHMFTLQNSIPIEQAGYSDTITLKTLTEEIFYKVTSVDYQGHLSKFSEVLKLTRPDTIAPFPPSITDYNQEKDHIFFNWTPSRSQDVIKHELYRKVNDKNWALVTDIDYSASIYKDYKVSPNNLYTYKMIAIDDAMLKSVEHATVRVKFVDQSLPEIVQINNCTFLDSTLVELTWTGSNDPKNKNIIVYRSINDGPLTVVSRVEKEQKYVDRISPKRSYAYAIKQIWNDGKKSGFSNTVKPQKR